MQTTLILILGTALIGGFLAKLIKLPPMVGFLLAGYVLYALGVRSTEIISFLADMGVTALLFTIGLKLRLKALTGREVLGVGLAHMIVWAALDTLGLMGLAATGWAPVADLDWRAAGVIGLALSFSSTVYVVKLLDARGQQQSRYGSIAIGILVIQDLVAVLFMSMTSPHTPSPWALALLALPLTIPFLRWILGHLGHGELMVLTGLVFAFGGYLLFYSVGLKGDLGALVMGVLVGQTAQGKEMYTRLTSVKELLLIAFFVNVGLYGIPGIEMFWVALILLAILPVKSALFLILFRIAGGRPRIHAMSSATLTNYSEFALVIGAVALQAGWIEAKWISALAIALAGSFLGSAIVFRFDHTLLEWLIRTTVKNDTAAADPAATPAAAAPVVTQLPPLDFTDIDAVVIGMGRVGQGSYRQLHEAHGLKVRGVEANPDRVHKLQDLGADIIEADGADPLLWAAIDAAESVKYVLVALPLDDDWENHESLLRQFAEHRLGHNKPNGERRTYRTVVATRFQGQQEKLLESGADDVIYVYKSAGAELADLAVAAPKPVPENERFD